MAMAGAGWCATGHAPEREIQTGLGPIAVRRPKLRDRGDGADGARLRFTSKVLPPFLRRTRNVEALLPWLYLKGISTGQFGEALTALLGADAPGLSASTVRRLVAAWQQEHERWQQRDLSMRRCVYPRRGLLALAPLDRVGGGGCPARPPTPPCVRVRTRRFERPPI